VCSSDLRLGNVTRNPRTGQSPTQQLRPMGKTSKKTAPAKMKKY